MPPWFSALAPGSVRGDGDGREVDRRKRRNRQQPISEDAEYDESSRDQRGQNWTADAKSRTTPCAQDPALRRAARPCPLVSCIWPSVTTVSPPCEAAFKDCVEIDDARDLDRLDLGDPVLDDEDV